MSMIFQLRMIGTEDEEFLRDYELPYTLTLLDFHRFICTDLEYDPMNMSSFFTSNERWEQEQEFTLADMGGGYEGAPLPMESVTLGQLLRKNHDRLIYVFDPFGERALFLELLGTIKRMDGIEYPRTHLGKGKAPEQFDPKAMEGAGITDSVFQEAMDDFFEFDGDDFYDDEF